MKTSATRVRRTPRPSEAATPPGMDALSEYRRAHAADVIGRLRRVEGQVKGLIQMIESGRPCEDIAQQMSAVRRAMDKVFLRMMTCSVMECVEGGDRAQKEDLERVVSILSKYG